MEIEYDTVRDLLYIWFARPGAKAAKTETVVPGVHADFDRGGRLIGIEVLDAQHRVQSEVELAPSPTQTVPA